MKIYFMKKILMLLSCFVLVTTSYTQNIIAAEYFIDADPGTGNGLAVSIVADTTVRFTKDISTSGVQPGFHFLSVRVKNSDGRWDIPEKRGFYVSGAAVNAANISAAEYFIDADPGTGKATSLSVGTNASVVNFTANISTSSLGEGFHVLCIRVKNTQRTWSIFEKRGFYISATATDAGTINAAEYFVDTDLGTGLGLPLSVGAASDSARFIANIPVTSLSQGFHFLCIRAKNTQKTWSVLEKRGFYISGDTRNAGKISAAEYFIDNDPGNGSGQQLAIGGSNDTARFTANISTSLLSSGFHFLCLRVKNAQSVWNIFEKRSFYVSPASGSLSNINVAEYFIDTDPGTGNGKPLTIDTPGAIIKKHFSIKLPNGISNGSHFIGMRFKTADKKWSIFEFDTVVVQSQPQTLITLSGTKDGNNNLLNITFSNTVNPLYSEIERSNNGITFTQITRVDDNGKNQYTFNDDKPLNGFNFYRVKQFLKDGSSVYSNIIRISPDAISNFIITPNLASTIINLHFGTTKEKLIINIYDANGRMVTVKNMNADKNMQLNVAYLPAGKYYVQVTDGLVQKNGAFIKQ